MASDYHNNQSSGSLSEHQPVQRLQNLQFHSVQDYGRKYTPELRNISSACYNSALCRSGFLICCDNYCTIIEEDAEEKFM